MQVFLKKHGIGHANHSLKFSWTRTDRLVKIDVEVKKRLPKKSWIFDEQFTSDWAKNWGLWNKDVVEAFLQLRSTPDDLKAPYLEIQVSPKNQPFALIITEPRKTFHEPSKLSFKHHVTLEEKIWTATLEVELPTDLHGTLLYGGFFACLDQDPREFYALEPNPEANPDFHRPELFLPLDEA